MDQKKNTWDVYCRGMTWMFRVSGFEKDLWSGMLELRGHCNARGVKWGHACEWPSVGMGVLGAAWPSKVSLRTVVRHRSEMFLGMQSLCTDCSFHCADFAFHLKWGCCWYLHLLLLLSGCIFRISSASPSSQPFLSCWVKIGSHLLKVWNFWVTVSVLACFP